MYDSVADEFDKSLNAFAAAAPASSDSRAERSAIRPSRLAKNDHLTRPSSSSTPPLDRKLLWRAGGES